MNANIARELLAVAKELMAIEFPTQDAMKKYLDEHPDADKSNHRVVEKKDAPVKSETKRSDLPIGLKFPLQKHLDELEQAGGDKDAKQRVIGINDQLVTVAEAILNAKSFDGVKDSLEMVKKNLKSVEKDTDDVAAKRFLGEAKKWIKELEWTMSKAKPRGASVVRELLAVAKELTASAGPYTLLEQIRDDLRNRMLYDDRNLRIVGFGIGHTKGADYIFGDAGAKIVNALIGFEAGHELKIDVWDTVRENIDQALKDNKPFKGLRAEQAETHDLWKKMMKNSR